MFKPKLFLTRKDIEKGLNLVTKHGIFAEGMATLSGGVFLAAFALELGASNFIIGLLAAIPALMQLLQLPATYVVEKVRNRRLVTSISATFGRFTLLLLAAIPFYYQDKGLALLIVAITLNSSFSALTRCNWNSWLKDLVPENRLGTFFSKRLAITSTASLILSLVAGFFVDWWKDPLQSYGFLFSASFLFGITSLFFLYRVPEPQMAARYGKINIKKLITTPFKDDNFRNMIKYLGSWNFALNLAAPFFTVYMLVRLEFSVFLVIGFQVLTQLVNILFLRIWGRFSQTYNNKAILSIGTPVFLISLLAWTFTTLPEKHSFTLPLLVIIHILMGISLAGIRLGSDNISLKLAPRGDSTSYLAATSFVNSLAAGIAPIIGGLFADFFKARELTLALSWTSPNVAVQLNTLSLSHWDFFFIFSFIIGLYSFHRLSKVEEYGKMDKSEQMGKLISEVQKEMRNLSTLAGIRPMLKFPTLIASRFRKRR